MTTSDLDDRWIPIRSPEAIGRTVRRYRKQAGLTQAEFAVRARGTRQAIIALESGLQTRALQLVFDALATLNLEICNTTEEALLTVGICPPNA